MLGSFQGSGHTLPVMVLNMVRLWGIRIPAAYLLAMVLGMGPAGLWWAMFLSNTVTALAAFVWFSRGGWKRRIIDVAPSAVAAPGVGESVVGEVGRIGFQNTKYPAK